MPLEAFQGLDGGEEHMFDINGAEMNTSTFIKERPIVQVLNDIGDTGRARRIVTMDGSHKKEFDAEGPRNNFVALNLKNKRLMCFTHQRKKGPTSGGKRAWLPPELFAKQQKHKWIQEAKERRCTDALQIAVASTDNPADFASTIPVAGVKQQFEKAVSDATQVCTSFCVSVSECLESFGFAATRRFDCAFVGKTFARRRRRQRRTATTPV